MIYDMVEFNTHSVLYYVINRTPNCHIVYDGLCEYDMSNIFILIVVCKETHWKKCRVTQMHEIRIKKCI